MVTPWVKSLVGLLVDDGDGESLAVNDIEYSSGSSFVFSSSSSLERSSLSSSESSSDSYDTLGAMKAVNAVLLVFYVILLIWIAGLFALLLKRHIRRYRNDRVAMQNLAPDERTSLRQLQSEINGSTSFSASSSEVCPSLSLSLSLFQCISSSVCLFLCCLHVYMHRVPTRGGP